MLPTLFADDTTEVTVGVASDVPAGLDAAIDGVEAALQIDIAGSGGGAGRGHGGDISALALQTVGLATLWLIPMIALWGLVAAALGSMVPSRQEMGGVQGPVTMALVVGMIAAQIATTTDSSIFGVLAYFPPYAGFAGPGLFIRGELSVGWREALGRR